MSDYVTLLGRRYFVGKPTTPEERRSRAAFYSLKYYYRNRSEEFLKREAAQKRKSREKLNSTLGLTGRNL